MVVDVLQDGITSAHFTLSIHGLQPISMLQHQIIHLLGIVRPIVAVASMGASQEIKR